MKKNSKNPKKQNKFFSPEEKEKLYKYYQEQIIKITNERYDSLKDINDIDNLVDSYQEKEWDLRKLIDKINEYQLKLSQTNMTLIKERKKIINYINEIENYRCKLITI
jgi:chromosome segregation ATPase